MGGTNWTNISDMNTMLSAANTFSPFWLGIFFMIWMVLLISFLNFGTEVALIGSSFIAFLIGLPLVYMNLMSWKYLLMPIGMILLTVIINTIFSKKE